MKVQYLPLEYLKGLGHRIKMVRVALNLSQKHLSESWNTGPAQVSRVENGSAAPSLYQLLQLKRLVDKDSDLKGKVTWEWLLEGQGAGVFEKS
jgi:transcriptional regulator with XRE-family HTH domain